MHTSCLNEYLSYGQNVCPVCKSSPCKPQHEVNELVNDADPQVHDDVDNFDDGWDEQNQAWDEVHFVDRLQ